MIRTQRSYDLPALRRLPAPRPVVPSKRSAAPAGSRRFFAPPAAAAPLGAVHSPLLMVVLTGGPCGGKTTLLEGKPEAGVPDLPHALAEHGIHATVVPEAAAEEITANGLPPDGPGGVGGFNLRITRRQLAKEEAAKRSAWRSGAPLSLIICDRGPPDNLAFMTPEQTAELRTALGDQQSALDPTRFDAVMHLVTAAHGAEAAYRWSKSPQNPVSYRVNPPEEARALDDRLRAVYSANPEQHVFDNAGFDPQDPERSYRAKRQAVLDSLVHLVESKRPRQQTAHQGEKRANLAS